MSDIIEIDCTTGERRERAFTPPERAARSAAAAAAAQERQAADPLPISPIRRERIAAAATLEDLKDALLD